MKTTQLCNTPPTQSRRRTTVVGLVTITVFAGLSVASGNSKSEGKAGTTGAAVSAGGDPSKDATLVGSCDRSAEFYKDCTESFAPSTVADAKSSCKSLGGRFRTAPCPRINAVSVCFEGNPPHLSASYAYEGRKSKTEAGDCNRAFKDLKKDPELKPNTSPAGCNAVATGGTCSVFSAVNADSEHMCLENGGRLEQPPKPCPSTNGLAALKLTTKEGLTTTEYFYTTEYKDAEGSHTWKMEDILLICGLAGSNCAKVPFAPAGDAPAASASASAAPAKPAAKAPAKPAAKK